MQTNNLYKLGMAALLTLSMIACTPKTDTDDTSTSDMGSNSSTSSTTTTNSGSNASTTGAGNASGLTAREMRVRDAALATTVFYFEFDSSDLDADAREALIHHANRLKENSNMRIRLEGHADERGTREYNLALGERRAQAIERYLLVQGVSSRQMETISYGEESPVASGSNETSWSRNRRVEIH